MPTAQDIETKLKSELGASHVVVRDTSGGCGQAFEVTIVSDAFNGKNRLTRHKAVNSALKSEIASVHAFMQKTFTTEEWDAQNAKLTN